MRAEKLISDPVFQLNLLLWMAKEQPDECFRVRPVFHDLGFVTLAIEQPFRFPVAVSNQIAVASLEIGSQPEPELILANHARKQAIYFECKAHSFGSESSNCKQARGHMVATGDAFAEVFHPLESCLLTYLIPEAERQGMQSCLRQMHAGLSSAGFSTGRFSVHGLRVQGSSIIYTWDDACTDYLATAQPPQAQVAVLENIQPETNPAPLMLVYSDEDCPDETSRDQYRRILCEKLRACLLCELNQQAGLGPAVLSADGLLHSTTGGMYKYLGRERQKKLQAFVRTNVFGFIAAGTVKSTHTLAKCDGPTLTLTWTTANEKRKFLEWLEDRKNMFPAERIKEPQMPLFVSE